MLDYVCLSCLPPCFKNIYVNHIYVALWNKQDWVESTKLRTYAPYQSLMCPLVINTCPKRFARLKRPCAYAPLPSSIGTFLAFVLFCYKHRCVCLLPYKKVYYLGTE